MLKNFNVDIYTREPGKKVNGIYIPGDLNKLKNIYCDIQPYSTELFIRQYGFNIEVNKIILIDYFDPDIKIGSIIQYTNKQSILESYEIKKTIPWENFMEVFALGI